jgi:transcriptional regulator with GAF, ATPase, and Fis domain
MRPRLVSVSGAAPTEIPLNSAGLTIGRDATNSLRLEDPAVSAQHCRIEFDNGQFILIDRESMNGTFVNRKAATRTTLRHGDEILIGHIKFYFLVTEDASPLLPQVRIADIDEETLVSSATVQLNPTDSAYLRAQFADDDIASLRRRAKDMSALVKLSVEIHGLSDGAEVQDMLLQRIFERIPAEEGVVALGSSVDQLVAGAQRPRQLDRPISVSRKITHQVLTSGQAVLRNDLLAAEDTSETIRSSGLRSVMCVPLTVMNVRTGVIYLSTRNPTPFDEQHLELVTAIAGIGALALEHVRYVDWLEVQNRQLTHELNLGHGMVGENAAMRKVYQDIALIAPTSSPVLLLGESGTGKELAARAIHNNSNRRNGPFIAVNCGAVVETLFSGQLLGYVRGAFTGADRDHKGFIEEADGGTLFLDELGDLPLHCQAALLRVLDDSKVQRVGSSREIPVDIRLISATNRQLSEEMAKGSFRSDLYYRMGLPIMMPPLRERVDDIALLVNFFLQKYKSQTQRELGSTHPDTIRVLQQYSWPGNVRELGRAIQWAVVFGKSDRIRPEDLPPGLLKTGSRAASASTRNLEEALQSHERQLILKALEETHGNVVEAASLLGRAPNYLQRRISQLNLRKDLDKIRGGQNP